jgi:hypothetical protein
MQKKRHLFLARATMTLLLALFTSIGAWATITGNGTQASPYTINSADDWNTFAGWINNSNSTYASKCYKLTTDITVSTMAGTSANPFKGAFDGHGYTITLNDLSIDGEEYCAPFRYVDGANISFVRTAGTVIATDKKYRSGLIGNSNGNTTINACWSSVTINSTIDGDGTHGGFVGTVTNGTLAIKNCLFDGTFNGNSKTSSWGGFVGWSQGTTNISNSVFHPAGVNKIKNQTSNGNATFGRNNVNATNSYYYTQMGTVQGTAVGSTSASDLRKKLGCYWETGYNVMPIMGRHGIYTEYSVGSVYASDLPNTNWSWNNYHADYFYKVSNLVDGDKGSTWRYVTTSNKWSNPTVDFEYPNELIVKGYTVWTGDEAHLYPNSNPKGWKLYGKKNKDDASWTLIDEQTNAGLSGTSWPKGFSASSNNTSYKYYRFEVTSMVGLVDGVYKCQLGDLKLYGIPEYGNTELSWATITMRDSYDWTGNTLTVTPTVTSLNGNTLTNGTDYTYTISPSTVKDLGDYTLNVTGKGNYSGVNSANFKVVKNISGAGSSSNPYLINTVADWNAFATLVNNGTSYKGLYVKLNANITVSEMVGTSEANSFQGTFLGASGKTLTLNLTATGDNCAPFQYLKDATIKDLNVAGTVSTGYKYGASIAAHTYGETNIQNCVSTAEITSTYSSVKDGTHGGFVAVNESGKLTFTNCVFAGKLLGGNAKCNGGFVGWAVSSIVYNNCLFAPADIQMAYNDSYTFNRNGNATFNGAFYTRTFNGAQGTQVYTDFSNTIAKREYTYNNTVYYSKATVTIGNVNANYAYTGSNITVTPTVSYGDVTLTNNKDYTYSISPSPVKATGTYTITFTGKGNYAGSMTKTFLVNQELTGAGTSASPYLIKSASDWNTFAANVESGVTYAGKYVKLNNNITVSTMVGKESAPFMGTFDGGGKTLNVNIVSTTTGSTRDEQGVAPFHFICDAVIKDLTVTGSITSANKFASGLVGYTSNTSKKTTEITNCVVKPTITVQNNYIGGIIGYMFYEYSGSYRDCKLYLTNCVFAGTIQSANDEKRSSIGGILAYHWSGNLYINNCLENGTYKNIKQMSPLCGSSSSIPADITGLYYLNTIGEQNQNVTDEKGCHRVVKTVPTTDIYSTRTIKGYTVYQPATLTGMDNTYAHTGNTISLSYALKMGATDMVENTDYVVTIKDSKNKAVEPANLKDNGNYTIHFTAKSGNAAGYQGETVYSFRISQAETLGSYTFATEGDGDSKVYLINDEDDLEALAAYVNADKKNTCEGLTFKLNNDITMKAEHTAIGRYDYNTNYLFKGTFDGNNKTITGLTINKTSGSDADSYQGLFGYVVNAVIKDVTLVDCDITGYRYVGGIVGAIYGSNDAHAVIQNCHVSGTIASVIANAYNHGGIAGYCKNVDVTGCTVTGNVTNKESSSYYGGIVGEAYTTTTITSCENSANVTGGGSYHGGIAGYCWESKLSQCLTTGTINQTGDNALIGNDYNGQYTNCYYTSGTSRKGEFVSAITGQQMTSIIVSEAATVTSVIDGSKYYKAGDWTVTLTPDQTNSTFIKYACEGGALTNLTTIDGEHTLTIGKAPVTIIAVVSSNSGVPMSNVAISDIADQRWRGKGALTPEFTVTYNNTELVENTDYLKEYSDNVEVGTASITLTGIGNYRGTTVKTFNIVDFALQTPGKDNSAENPYLVKSEEDLQVLADIVNRGVRKGGFYQQTEPITLKAEHTAIGNSSNKFEGSYDGQNLAISGLVINKPNDSYQGLFGYIGSESSVIQNVNIVNCDITGGSSTGGVVGYAQYAQASILHCQVSGSVKCTSNMNCIGGVAGYSKSFVDDCVSTASVSGGGSYHGGIVGDNYGTVQNCFCAGSVEGSKCVGSIVGDKNSSTLINNFHLSTTTGGVGAYGSTTGTDQEGAELVVKITTNNDLITLTLPAKADYEWKGDKLYKNGTVVTLAYALPDQMIFDTYSVSSGAISDPLTMNGNHTLSGFAEDVVINGSHADQLIDFSQTGNSIIADFADFTFDGSEHHPEPVVTVNGRELVKDVNYTVSYDVDCTSAGKHAVTITGQGIFYNSTSKTFTIEAYDISADAAVTIAGIEATYGQTGSPVHPVPLAVTCAATGNAKLAAGTDYTLSYSEDCTLPGNYQVTVNGQGNYKGSKSVDFTILEAYGITVFNDNATSQYLPVYGYYGNYHQKNEFVMPASELEAMDGAYINSMQFYISSKANSAWTGTFQVFMKEVDATTISNFSGTNGATIVYEGSLDGTKDVMTINFSTPYAYQGGNLLIGIYETTRGTNDPSAYFYGKIVNGASVGGTNRSDLDGVYSYQRNFLPKTTFWFDTPMVLVDNATDNSKTINDNDNEKVNVLLRNRTLYKDGEWNTICLPFDVTLKDSPLKGGIAKTLTDATMTGTTVSLTFGDAEETLKAGVPYLIKWEVPADLVIKTADDWNNFATAVSDGNTYKDKVVRLAADITVSEMVGTSGNKFKGTFMGDGHTLDLNDLKSSGEFCAPFRYVDGATISNLHTTGTVIADSHTSNDKYRTGLVGQTEGNTTINNCWSSVAISSKIDGDGTHGGFVGVANGTTKINNCRFDGSITGSDTHSCGGFVGWSNGSTEINNCLFAPEGISLKEGLKDCYTFSRNTGNVTVKNCYYTQTMGGAQNGKSVGEMSNDDLVANDALGNQWQVKAGKVVPVMGMASSTITNPVFTNVTIAGKTDEAIRTISKAGGHVKFIGNYDAFEITEKDDDIYYLSSGNKLRHTGKARTMNACRAYFKFSESVLKAREFVLNFEDETTEIKEVKAVKALGWYTIDGMKLNGEPKRKGMYIYNGRKTVIK